MGLVSHQQKTLAIITHVTGSMSLFGSSWIMYEILKDRTKWDKTYHRLLFVMSFFDMLTSIAMGLSSVPIPAGTEGVFYGHGNTRTCSVQGFFIHLSIIGPFYNACLSIYYVLRVRKGMRERDLLKKVEPYMHLACNVTAWAIAFTALFLGMYNNATLWCSINDFPGNCQGGKGEPGPVPCERGFGAWIFRWSFYYGPLWVTLLIVPAMMVLLHDAVRKHEKDSARYEVEARSRRLSSKDLYNAKVAKRKVKWSKKVASQALFYTIFFYLTFIFATINRLAQLIFNKDFYVLLLLHIMFAPLQGFFNFLIYMRPRFLMWYTKQREPEQEPTPHSNHATGGNDPDADVNNDDTSSNHQNYDTSEIKDELIPQMNNGSDEDDSDDPNKNRRRTSYPFDLSFRTQSTSIDTSMDSSSNHYSDYDAGSFRRPLPPRRLTFSSSKISALGSIREINFIAGGDSESDSDSSDSAARIGIVSDIIEGSTREQHVENNNISHRLRSFSLKLNKRETGKSQDDDVPNNRRHTVCAFDVDRDKHHFPVLNNVIDEEDDDQSTASSGSGNLKNDPKNPFS